MPRLEARRRALLLLAATAVMASAVGTFSSISQADCAAPLVDTVKFAQPGETIPVRGVYWAAECNDVVSCTAGCIACSGDEKSPPYTDLQITLVEEIRPGNLAGIPLAEGIDADTKNFRVRTEITLPDDLRPGRYQIAMGNEESGMVRSNVFVVKYMIVSDP
jgi:hypothetical protein